MRHMAMRESGARRCAVDLSVAQLSRGPCQRSNCYRLKLMRPITAARLLLLCLLSWQVKCMVAPDICSHAPTRPGSRALRECSVSRGLSQYLLVPA